MRLSLDSNVLVYAADGEAGERHIVALDLVERTLRGDGVLALRSLAGSFYVTARKAKLEVSKAAGYVDDWRAAFPLRAADRVSSNPLNVGVQWRRP